jgi:mannose-6-phosphate isomerase-like protein (cupin superfamily)
MAGYAVANLKELENSAERFGLAPHVEARFARTALDAEETGLSYQRLAPGARYPFGHRHADQEEIYVVLSGGGRVKLDDEVVGVRPWDAIRVAPETIRCFEGGPDGLELLAFGTHTDAQPEMIPGWWSDDDAASSQS